MWSFTLLGVISASVSRIDHKKWKWKNIQATHPLQLVHLYYLPIEVTEGGKDVHMLIFTDHFTRYVQALITSLQIANCTS